MVSVLVVFAIAPALCLVEVPLAFMPQ